MVGKRLPGIQTMRALEAAVRLRCFTKAADELALSQGAVSQHIRALEQRLGHPLFVRTARGVEPSPVSQALALQIRQGLTVLDRAFDPAPGASRRSSAPATRQRLNISTLPAFAAKWLMPRLDDFARLHPEIELEIQTSGALARLDATDGIDAAIRYGGGTWPGLSAEHLMDEMVFPVVSPHYRGGRLPPAPTDLQDCVLLRQSAQPWTPWFQAAGLAFVEPQDGVVFSDMLLALRAAVAGQGIVLARRSLVEEELRSGSLVRLWAHEVIDVHAHYLVWPLASSRLAAIGKLRTWLVGQVAEWLTEGPR
jgi:LysR family glycine cleavage system transcriptional activator